jgi:Rrf2 family nitric oxide-sensitive transcriptional repressor
MYCAASEGRANPVTISEIAQAHGISHSHLTKVVVELAAHGLLGTTRGRGGGLRLLKPAGEIVVGEVVRLSESDFTMVECFDGATQPVPHGRPLPPQGRA